ncbi:UDP-glucose--hexose-1-phosphate uridylyltransferase [Pseudohalioglobus sediminis]|uniref:Galactose-1-phosphate uridylyltransferase n=1 Tax=Pseudohalioglobus sediminis TaxID=2606449 RepID=A0A5B0X2G9_9GAMM|nr:UDP-glucose--hexose-1-phosphate uridylyltransferase [Pseudohalioglobus sediminis]KAA1192511.1 UDP-glucose--hexose-1-phosphate uridylyltransferase [Pseudohalioglobus sediminis]
MKPTDLPHRRRNPLTGDFVQLSPHRMQRPWQGQEEANEQTMRSRFSKDCHLCPGNQRSSGLDNPVYTGTYVFENDFPALLEKAAPGVADHPLLQQESARGCCRVICFSPRHDLTLAEMAETDIVGVIDTWAEQHTELSASYRWVQLFENKGAMMGCSSPHPHGQVWATSALPNEAVKEQHSQQGYWSEHGRAMLLDYAELEVQREERVVVANDEWLVVVPFWAAWPFETLLLPRFAVARIDALTATQRQSLAAILKRLLVRYDNLFATSFPYSMGWHNAPGPDTGDARHWQLHAHFYPPLLRSATVRKFMVGYELLAEAQRDLTPEQAAEKLRQQAERHYRAT